MTQQEEQVLAEMKAEPVTEEHIRRAEEFIEKVPYTHLSLLAMAETCRREFDNEDMARILTEAANRIAEVECQVI